MSNLNQLANLIGFNSSYQNCFNETIEPQEDALIALVKAMGFDVSSDEALAKQATDLSAQDWQRMVSHCEILATDQIQRININLPVWIANFSYVIELEDGELIEAEKIVVDTLPCLNSHLIDGQEFKRYTLELPILPMGYHRIAVSAENQSDKGHLIVAPQTCLSPREVTPNKMWGIAVQLYSLHSDSSWGIGDFSTLKSFVAEAAKKGVNAIGLNPLHPLFPSNPAHRSPYSPTSRSFLNSMYIDVQSVPNFSACDEAQAILNDGEFQLNLGKVKHSEFIDYGTVGYLKYKVLKALFNYFLHNDIAQDSVAAERFSAFRQSQGKDLENIATYDALYQYFRESNVNSYGWTSWPMAYQDPNSYVVKNFQQENADRVTYFAWLQWLCHEQLSAVQDSAKEHGMKIGLYLDLAVGCDGNGAEVWADQSSYLAGAAVGAPPDAMNILGQDWGLTPINPVALRNSGFAPLVKALRSSMQYGGALRIDHILGFMRQYWVAPGKGAAEGIYISFPLADILRVIALESRRNHCIVIGEDLGTVPDGFGEIMAAHGLLSYKVLFFERWENGLFMRPDTYPEQSMATGSTHDLHTSAGWWTGNDLVWRRSLNLYPNQAMADNDANSRISDREYLRAAMIDMHLMDADDCPAEEHSTMPHNIGKAAQQYLAMSSSALHLIPAEDLLELEEQVNIPGTTEEHPNWKRKLPCDVDTFFKTPCVIDTMQAVATIRPN
jgi:4-alpha-glucanotransferase